VNWSSSQQAATCRMLIEQYGAELESGAIVTAEPGRVRIRPLGNPS
jgi:hypothetical protein